MVLLKKLCTRAKEFPFLGLAIWLEPHTPGLGWHLPDSTRENVDSLHLCYHYTIVSIWLPSRKSYGHLTLQLHNCNNRLSNRKTVEHLTLQLHNCNNWLSNRKTVEHLTLQLHNCNNRLSNRKTVEHLTLQLHNCNNWLSNRKTIDHLTLQLHNCNNWLSNRMTCSIIMLASPPTESQICYTLFDIISLGVDAV